MKANVASCYLVCLSPFASTACFIITVMSMLSLFSIVTVAPALSVSTLC